MIESRHPPGDLVAASLEHVGDDSRPHQPSITVVARQHLAGLHHPDLHASPSHSCAPDASLRISSRQRAAAFPCPYSSCTLGPASVTVLTVRARATAAVAAAAS